MRGGRVVCDAAPAEFLGWACAEAPELATPGARLLFGLGVAPAAGVRAARSALRSRGLLAAVAAPPVSDVAPAGRRGDQVRSGVA